MADVLCLYRTFYKRIRNEYHNRKDFYALSYDADEVIDAVSWEPDTSNYHAEPFLQGLRGNEARFINHSCGPNLEVRKYQIMGNGSEEFEVGFWALRDIPAGEEVCFVHVA
jgi:SET domain-containing protein